MPTRCCCRRRSSTGTAAGRTCPATAGPAGTSRRSPRCATPAASTSSSALGPEYLEAEDDAGLANVILTNGARLYVDHAHPEYSTPEVTNPRDVVLWDKAGERIMAEASRRAAQTVPGQPPIQLYKNNTDNKGPVYGVARELPDAPGRPRSRTSSGT